MSNNNDNLSDSGNSREMKNKIDYYAQCFLDLAKAEGDVDRFEEDFRQLKGTVINNLDLKKFLTDLSVEKPEKIKTAFEITSSGATNTIRAAMATMITMDAIESIEAIYNRFVLLVNKLKTQILVEVISAVKLDENLMDKIKKSIDEKTKLDVRLKNVIDKNIIGGLLIKIGDRIIDLSVKSKINDLRTRLHSLEFGGEEFVSSNKDG